MNDIHMSVMLTSIFSEDYFSFTLFILIYFEVNLQYEVDQVLILW